MGRPRTPLITREAAARSALELIDDEGLDSFTLPGLSRKMGVNPSSLYHHFGDRSDVFASIAQLIVREVPRARRTVDPTAWQVWLIRQSLHLRRAILRHRSAAPVLVQFTPRSVLIDLFEDAASYLSACDVPVAFHVRILDAIETLSIGAAITEAMRPRPGNNAVFPQADTRSHPFLVSAMKANPLSPRQLHEASLRSFLRGLDVEMNAHMSGARQQGAS